MAGFEKFTTVHAKYRRGPGAVGRHASPSIKFHWEAGILEERKSELIEWRTIEIYSNLEHEGAFSLRPALGNRGRILSLDCRWTPARRGFGVATAKLLHEDPTRSDDLQCFHQLMEVFAIDHYPQRLDLARLGHPGQIHVLPQAA